MSSWLAMLQDAAEMFVFLAVELSLLFIVISAGVSLIRQKVPDHKIQQMMGARKGRGYLLAALLGAVTPFCSCSTIPMLRGLLSAKAGFGPTLTFLFVSPLLNPIIVGLMWVTFGWKVTLLYAIIAAGVSVLASIILDSLGFERHIIASKSSSANCCAPAKTSPGTTYTPIEVSCCSPTAKAFDYINVIFTEHVFIGGMNTVDIGGTAGDQRFPVELVDGGIETIIRAVHMDRFTDLRRVPHHFFRHTANIYAGAAQFFGFNQRAFLTVHSRAVDGGDTAAAAADGDVIIVFSHDRVSLSLITAIVARDVIGASDGCNYSGTIQLTVA